MEKGCDIRGMEIREGAEDVCRRRSQRGTGFLVGNEYGNGTASLNVTVAASTVLRHFAVWAGFPERIRDGNKFVVAEKPLKQTRQLLQKNG